MIMIAKRALLASFCRTPLLPLIAVCSLLNMSLAEPSSCLFHSPFESSNCINTIPIIPMSTKLQCARLCGQLDGCLGFFHKNDTLSCLLIDPTSSSDCMSNDSPQWTSWKKSTATEEQTTMPTITLPMNTYISTKLSDNTQFTFLYVQDRIYKNQAPRRCQENDNGTLVQIITAPKLDFLMDCLDRTFEDNVYTFWIDAIKVDGLWITSDGKAVLNDENYWYTGLTRGTKPCAVLNSVRHQIDDLDCASSNRFPYICEKTNE